MSKLLALPVLLAACVDAPTYTPQGDAPVTPIASRAMQTIADRPTIIAVGGAQTIAIDDPTSIGWSGDATVGFAVEPFDSDGWPNTERAEYWVRAIDAGSGSYAISTNRGLAVGTVEAAPVATVALVPVAYQLDGHSAFALAPGHTVVAAALLDPRDRRLIDATLVLGEAQRAAQVTVGAQAWDQVAIDTTVGHHTVDAVADSFAARQLGIDVDATIDRRVQVGSCWHAYHGAVEIVTDWQLPAADPAAANCTR